MEHRNVGGRRWGVAKRAATMRAAGQGGKVHPKQAGGLVLTIGVERNMKGIQLRIGETVPVWLSRRAFELANLDCGIGPERT